MKKCSFFDNPLVGRGLPIEEWQFDLPDCFYLNLFSGGITQVFGKNRDIHQCWVHNKKFANYVLEESNKYDLLVVSQVAWLTPLDNRCITCRGLGRVITTKHKHAPDGYKHVYQNVGCFSCNFFAPAVERKKFTCYSSA